MAEWQPIETVQIPGPFAGEPFETVRRRTIPCPWARFTALKCCPWATSQMWPMGHILTPRHRPERRRVLLDSLAQLGLGNRDGRRHFGGRGRGVYRVRRGDARADLLHWRL